MAEYLHQKKGSSLWYYKRRYPRQIEGVIGAKVFMQSLKTTNKREAERLSRVVSVQFDTVCQAARMQIVGGGVGVASGVAQESVREAQRSPEAVLAGIPSLMRLAASRVVEEQQHDPVGWRDKVQGWEAFYKEMLLGGVPTEAQRPAVEAQAILNGIQLVLKGESPAEIRAEQPSSEKVRTDRGSWESLVQNALNLYQHEVSDPRFKLAQRVLQQVQVQNTSVQSIQDALRVLCHERLKEVQPRTVKSQLDAAVSALRLVLPDMKAPTVRELTGVMQPRVGDRQSMSVETIQQALSALKERPKAKKVRAGYGGGASQFDVVAVRTLALLGLRPRELLGANTSALVPKQDVFGKTGCFFRIHRGKNRAAERDIPLSDGERDVLCIDELRAMLDWQERNPREVQGLVTSLGVRFKKVSGGTLYQMRHTWKEIAQHEGVDYELRERILGHELEGVAGVYGSGIPLKQGLDALIRVRKVLQAESQ